MTSIHELSAGVRSRRHNTTSRSVWIKQSHFQKSAIKSHEQEVLEAGAQCSSHMQKYETDAYDEHHIILQFWPLNANLHGRNTLYFQHNHCVECCAVHEVVDDRRTNRRSSCSFGIRQLEKSL